VGLKEFGKVKDGVRVEVSRDVELGALVLFCELAGEAAASAQVGSEGEDDGCIAVADVPFGALCVGGVGSFLELVEGGDGADF